MLAGANLSIVKDRGSHEGSRLNFVCCMLSAEKQLGSAQNLIRCHFNLAEVLSYMQTNKQLSNNNTIRHFTDV